MLKKLLKQTFHMTQKSQIKQPLSPFLSRAVTGTKESAKHAENVIAYFDFFHSVEHKKIYFEECFCTVEVNGVQNNTGKKVNHIDLEQHELLKTELTFLGKLSL